MKVQKNNSLRNLWQNFDTEKKLLVIIIAVSILARLAAAFYLGDVVTDLPGTYDQISYHNLAIRVLEGHGFSFGMQWWPITPANAPTAHWSFLYTFYLVFVYRIFGIHPLAARLIQAILVGIIQPWLVYLIGRKIFGSGVGLITAALTAIYAYFIYYAATLMTEPLYISAILGCIYFCINLRESVAKLSITKMSTKKVTSRVWLSTVGIGFTLGAAILLRQLLLLLAVFLFIWLLWALKKQAISKILVIGIIIALCILPFTIYNYARFNRFVLLNTNAGYAFFWGNHPIYGTHFVPILTADMGSYQELIPPELRTLDEAALDQALMKRGFQFIFDDPVRYFFLSLSRIPVYFMFWPSQNSGVISNISRLGSFGIMWPFMLIGIILVLLKWKNFRIMDRQKDIVLMFGFMLLYTGMHILSWALIRYRLPVDAVGLLFAGFAIENILVRTGVVKRNYPKDENLLRYTLHT